MQIVKVSRSGHYTTITLEPSVTDMGWVVFGMAIGLILCSIGLYRVGVVAAGSFGVELWQAPWFPVTSETSVWSVVGTAAASGVGLVGLWYYATFRFRQRLDLVIDSATATLRIEKRQAWFSPEPELLSLRGARQLRLAWETLPDSQMAWTLYLDASNHEQEVASCANQFHMRALGEHLAESTGLPFVG